jgi:peptide/nickel transport system permease protein
MLDSMSAAASAMPRPSAQVPEGFRLRGLEYLAFAGLGVSIFLAVGAHWLPLANPLGLDLTAVLTPPSAVHLLGTDELGRDLLSRLIFASQSSLIITAGGTVVALAFALLFGVTAGYLGGWWERL